jgi:hypothetical protein
VHKIIAAAAVAVGLSMGTVQPALATTSTPTSQCDQAKASIAKLRAAAASNPEPYKTAYTNMANSQQAALAYYCH